MTIESDRLDALIKALGLPMPGEMRWNYAATSEETACGTAGCALLVAAHLWPDHREMFLSYGSSTEIGEFFGLTREEVDDAFYFCAMDTAMKDVTPGQVAATLQMMRDAHEAPGSV